MKMPKSRFHTVWMAGVAVVSTTPKLSGQEPIGVQSEVVYTIGFDESELFFGSINHLLVAPDGRVLVYDLRPGDGPAVTVLSVDGDVVAQWGTLGDGPGELPGGPVGIAIENDTVFVAAAQGRLGLYTVLGQEIARSSGPPAIFLEASLSAGRMLAWRLDLHPTDTDVLFAAVFGPADGRAAWSERVLEMLPVASPLKSRPLLTSIPGGRLVVGYGDEYSLGVVAAQSGDTLVKVARAVASRTQAGTTAFLDRARQYLAHPDEAPEGWSSLVRRSDSPRGMVPHDDLLPMVNRVFWGPPGVLWVERGLGIDDEYSNSLDRPDDNRMWDLFKVGDHESEYLGPTTLPEGFRPFAGNSELIAGVVRDDWNREAVRVLRVTVPHSLSTVARARDRR